MIRTLIYGSCVSRDSFETFPADRYRLEAYVARQSLLSATTPARRGRWPATPPPSAFQRRSLAADWRSSLGSTIASVAGSTDLVLWDLGDERLGVYAFPDGTYVTRSVELIASGGEATVSAGARLLPFGSDDHLRLWREQLPRLLRLLEQVPHDSPIAVLALPWATSFADGTPTPSSFGLTAAMANTYYQPYYETLRSVSRLTIIDADTLRTPPAAASSSAAAGSRQAQRELQQLSFSLLADQAHRWGPAPLHYRPEVYAAVRDHIGALLELSTHDAHSPTSTPDQRTP